MKRSSIILLMIAVVASLFIACSNESAIDKFNEDSTAKVVIAQGSAKAIQAAGNDESFAVEDLYWFYTAVKTSGSFVTGQKTQFVPVKGTAENPQKGLVESSLGSFSKGGWTFVFKGYHSVPEEFDYDHLADDADAVYYAVNEIVLTADLQMTVELKEANGMPDAGFRISGISINGLQLYDPASCNLYVISGTQMPQSFNPSASIISPVAGLYDSQIGSVSFANADLKAMAIGTHNLLFVVTSVDANHQQKVVGYEPLTLLVKKGVQQVVSGTIDMDNALATITVTEYTEAEVI